MLVYVVTPEQFESAFLNWIKETDSDDRKIVHKVFNQFMCSPLAHMFHTCTGLISFGIVQWKVQFEEWVKQEIQRSPNSEANRRHYTDLLIQLLESSWAIERKLIVSECLEDQERQLMDRENA
jgi:hypothetical protein